MHNPKPQLDIERLFLKDSKLIADFEQKVMTTPTTFPLSVEEIEMHLKSGATMYGAFSQPDRNLMAKVGLYPRENDRFEVDLGVLPNFQGLGIGGWVLGRSLSQFILDNPSAKIFLTVHPENSSAVKIYKKLGFIPKQEIATKHGPRVIMKLHELRSLDEKSSKNLETHELVWHRPKPDSDSIKRMVMDYFNEESNNYDAFDAQSEKRSRFTSACNTWIAKRIEKRKVARLLSVGCGTGRREIEISDLANLKADLFGVEISPDMASIASERGLSVTISDWENAKVESNFDVILFPYWFGLLPTREDRLKALKKARQCLSPNGVLIVDVLSIDDQNEWGPMVSREFDLQKLAEHGYERGDLFYRKKGGSKVGFHHYFSKLEMENLLTSSGLNTEEVAYISYGVDPGKPVKDESTGAMIFASSPSN